MDTATKIDLLKEEYVLLQRFYEDLDQRVLSIKGWSATVAIAAIGVGFYQSHYLWLFASGTSLILWLLEALWKSFQYLHGERISVIEGAFRNDSFEALSPLQIYDSWFIAQARFGLRFWRNFALAIVSFPHVVTLATGIVLYAAGIPLAPR
jgi:hypothetical protein